MSLRLNKERELTRKYDLGYPLLGLFQLLFIRELRVHMRLDRNGMSSLSLFDLGLLGIVAVRWINAGCLQLLNSFTYNTDFREIGRDCTAHCFHPRDYSKKCNLIVEQNTKKKSKFLKNKHMFSYFYQTSWLSKI